MQRITKPVVNDLTCGGNNSVSDCVKIYTIRSLSNKRSSNPSSSDLSPSKYLNPFALFSTGCGATAVLISAGTNQAFGNNGLPAKATKALIVPPFAIASSLTRPLAKIDEGVEGVTKTINEFFNNSTSNPVITNSPLQDHDETNSNDSSDGDFKVSIHR